jgi:hypothetical protein
MGYCSVTDHGRSAADAASGCQPSASAAKEASSQSGIPNAALAGADDWEVGPCVNHLGNVTSWDINVRPRLGNTGVAVIASVYSGEVVARAILEAIQTAAVKDRRAALTRMMQLDEEYGLCDDDEQVPPARAKIGGEK